MPHMLAQEHMSFVDALRYGTTRDHNTINAALTAIGSTVTALVLTFTGNGIWTIGANISTPTNVLILIPDGVSVSGTAAVTWTCNGTIFAYNGSYLTGGMTIIKSAVSNPLEVSVLYSTTIRASSSGTGNIISADAGAVTNGPRTGFVVNNGTPATGISLSRNYGNTNSTWEIVTPNSGNLWMTRPGAGAPMISVNNSGMTLGADSSTALMLDVNSDAVGKTTAGSWPSRTSDGRVKRKVRPYLSGTDYLVALPEAYYFTFTGAGGTPRDGREYLSMMAEEVQAVAPDLVSETGIYLEGDPAPLLTLDISPLTYALVRAVKELDGRLHALEGATGRQGGSEEEPHPPARRKH